MGKKSSGDNLAGMAAGIAAMKLAMNGVESHVVHRFVSETNLMASFSRKEAQAELKELRKELREAQAAGLSQEVISELEADLAEARAFKKSHDISNYKK